MEKIILVAIAALLTLLLTHRQQTLERVKASFVRVHAQNRKR